MAILFTSKILNNILEEHKSIFSRLRDAENLGEQYRREIIESADALRNSKVIKILKGRAVEDIITYNEDFCVKELREHGFFTIADLYQASLEEISSVYGMTEDMAQSIKDASIEMFNKELKEVKITLSIDNKSRVTTDLVQSITKYKKSLNYIKEYRGLIIDNSDFIYSAMDDVDIGQNMLKWMFASKDKKNIAQESYEYLSSLLTGDYGHRAKDIMKCLEKTKSISQEQAWEEFEKDSILFFSVLEDVYYSIFNIEDAVYGLPEDLANEIEGESLFLEGLHCKLRKYQEWGVKYILRQKRVLLGDEMGLGKTIQAIGAMVSLRNTGATHFIVVCPASVMENWCREIKKHSTLLVTRIYGKGKMDSFNLWLKNGGVAVTTYETIVNLEPQNDFRFCMLVVDEAHYIKNPLSKRSQSIKKLSKKSDRLLFIAGTALENKVHEMIELIKMLQPDIVRNMDCVISLSKASQFRKQIAPVYYRRKRDEVLTELPELIENEEWCVMSKEEEEVYENSVLEQNSMSIRRLSWNIEDIKNSSKAKRMLEIIKEAESEGRKVIVFSFFIEVIDKISSILGDKCVGPINGSIPPEKRQDIIDEFDEAPEGTVLLSQIQSGGIGFNIQSASVVILCEPQLKPSIENQAISRVYRMGQTRNVLVYRLLCENTIDKSMIDLLAQKQIEFNEFADNSDSSINNFEIDEKTLGNIIKEELERINSKRAEKQTV